MYIYLYIYKFFCQDMTDSIFPLKNNAGTNFLNIME